MTDTPLAQQPGASSFVVPLRGNHFRDIDAKIAWAEAQPGDQLQLERDPDNEYDPNAIRVVNNDGVWLGFIPKEVAAWLARDMDAGQQFTCTVTDDRELAIEKASDEA